MRELEKQILSLGPGMMKTSRWEHCLRTADYALFLAKRFAVPEAGCRVAALAHDLARDVDLETQEQWARCELGVIPGFMQNAKQLLHGPASAWYLRDKLACRNESVIKAVCWHTTGHPDLDETGLVVFAADYMEPGRKHLNDYDRELLLDNSLDGLVLSILSAMDRYLDSKGIAFAPWSRELSQTLKNRYNGLL